MATTHVIFEHAVLTLLFPVFWYMLRTRLARTTSWIIRVSAWDWLYRRKGLPKDERQKLIADAARRDLGSR